MYPPPNYPISQMMRRSMSIIRLLSWQEQESYNPDLHEYHTQAQAQNIDSDSLQLHSVGYSYTIAIAWAQDGFPPLPVS